MDTREELAASFDTLVGQAEEAMLGAQFAVLDVLSGEIAVVISSLAKDEAAKSDKALWQHIKRRLGEYQRTCSYSLDTLESAFMKAHTADGKRYGPDGETAGSNAQAVLSRRYG